MQDNRDGAVAQNNYFGPAQEDAVLRYIRSTDAAERSRIYSRELDEPFRRMVMSILKRYPVYQGSYDAEELASNALTHLVMNFEKFDPRKPEKLSLKLGTTSDYDRHFIEVCFDAAGAPESIMGMCRERVQELYPESAAQADEVTEPDMGMLRELIGRMLALRFCRKDKSDYGSCRLHLRLNAKGKGVYTFTNMEDGRLIYHRHEVDRKAYSYLGTITRNYYKTHGLQTRKEDMKVQSYEFPSEVAGHGGMYEMEDHLSREDERCFRDALVEALYGTPELDARVVDAVVMALSEWPDTMEEANVKTMQKAFRDHIRDATGMEPKDVTRTMKRLGEVYNRIKVSMNN